MTMGEWLSLTIAVRTSLLNGIEPPHSLSQKAIMLDSLMKIPAFDFQGIDVQIGNENIPRLDRRHPISRIRTSRRSMCELVAAARRQFELPITIRQG